MILLFCHFFTMLSAIGTFLTGIGALMLAIWAMEKYSTERKNQTKLVIDYKIIQDYHNNPKSLYLDIILKNKGAVDLHTKKRFKQDENGKSIELPYVYKDSIETIKYSIELQIKKVKDSQVISDWFASEQYEAVVEHINLLKDLEVPEDALHPAFFMEPKEPYHLGVWLNLDKGLYEAKVIVVGAKEPDDFWHRRIPFEVK